MKDPEISEEEVAKCWNRNADSWAEQVRKGWDVYREYLNNPAFLEFVGDLGGKAVLDVGCGEGYNTRILAKRRARVTGVDISDKMIELARREEQRQTLGINYKVASFSDLSVFGDGSFDIVVSFMALMDGPDFEGVAREIFRVLRPQGELVFSITHPCFATGDLEWIRDEQDSCIKLTVSDYFDGRPRMERWRFSKSPVSDDFEPFVVPFFPRTLSQYINALIEAGFILKELEEPRPSDEACKKYPWFRRWRDHAAIFLYMRAVKP